MIAVICLNEEDFKNFLDEICEVDRAQFRMVRELVHLRGVRFTAYIRLQRCTELHSGTYEKIMQELPLRMVTCK